MALSPFQRANRYQRIPSPDSESAQEASSVYSNRYGQMPIPATAFATSATALRSTNDPSVRAPQWEAALVQRANRRDGLTATGGLQTLKVVTPQVMDPPDSSKFQDWLIGPHVDYILNSKWYIAYPAATVMNGGTRNQALSTRVDQIPTRTSGGPTGSTMRAAPRFRAVQTVPRYSTMPPTYPTASTSQ